MALKQYPEGIGGPARLLGIVLNHCQYGVLYLGSCYNTGPYINFGNSNLGKLPVGKLTQEAARGQALYEL